MLVKLGVTLGVIAMVFSFTSPASAALTLGALTITSDGALTMATTGAFTVPTVTLANGETIANATDGGIILASSSGSIVGGDTNSSNPLLKVSTDTLDPTHGVRQGALSVTLNRPDTDALTSWDGNGDIALRVSSTNRAINGTNGGTRGMEVEAKTYAGGTESWLSGAKFTAENRSGAQTVLSSTVGEFYMKNNSIVSTSHYGILIQDDSQGVTVPTNYAALKINTATYALTRANAVWIDSGAGSGGFTSGVRFDGTITNVLTFADEDGTNGATADGADDFYAVTTPQTADGLIQVDIAGTSYWIPVYDAASVTNE